MSSTSSRSTFWLYFVAKGFIGDGDGDSDSIYCFRILRSSLRTIVSLILAQNLTAGRVCWNCCASGEEQLITNMFDYCVSVRFKQFIIGLSPSTKWFFLLVATFISWVESELKLLVTKVLTVVSRMKASELVTLCSEPASSTKFSWDSSWNPIGSLLTSVNWTTRWLLFLISWSVSLELKVRRSLKASCIIWLN